MRIFANADVCERYCMENELFGIDVTCEFIRVNVPKNETEKEVVPACLMDEIDGYASFILDPTGRVAYWSPSAVRLTGYTPEEINGQHFSCLYDGRETQMHRMPQSCLSIALNQGFHEYQGWWLRRDVPRFLARVMIMSIGNTGCDFAVMVWDMSKNRRALEVMGDRHRTSVLDD